MTPHPLTTEHAPKHLHREEDGSGREQQSAAEPMVHTSVFLEETITALAPQGAGVYLDATAGQGGHSEAILRAAPKARVVALDADPVSVELARKRLTRFGARAEVVEANFADAGHVLHKLQIPGISGALFDLGWNSGQLTLGRGFSFVYDEPLNMSYGPKPASGFTAREVVNEWDEKTLADVFFGYGEERYARRIAHAIIERRVLQPIETTLELVEIIRDAVPAPYRHGRIHPATRTFQALRMAVNDELGVIERGLAGVWGHVVPQGRIAVITFHSIEDRLVKRLMASLVKEGSGELVFKKPLVPTRSEITSNPRARSAKLRVIEKI